MVIGFWTYEAEPSPRLVYNNTAYHLAKRVLERATGSTIAEYMAERLAGPIELQEASWQDRMTRKMPDDIPRTGLVNRRGTWPASGS